MCKFLKNLFAEKAPAWPHYNKVALLFGINDYPGSGSDLNGCLNDLDLVKQKLPDFQIREFRDRQVTRERFRKELNYAIENALPGDVIYTHYSGHGSYIPDRDGDEIDGYDETLYLYDGNFIDDETHSICETIPEGVIFILGLDCCYSGTSTRNVERHRFMPPKLERQQEHIRIKRAMKETMNWIVLSGCSENETSADAFINGKYNGAFTFFAFNTLDRSLTYRQWFEKINLYLPCKEFSQSPTLEGSSELLDRVVFT